MTQGLIGLYLFVNLMVFSILPKDHPIKHLFGKIPRKFVEVLYVCLGSAHDCDISKTPLVIWRIPQNKSDLVR